jgi:type 1 fimbria pilin
MGEIQISYSFSYGNFGDAPAYNVQFKIQVKGTCTTDSVTPQVHYYNIGTVLNNHIWKSNSGGSFTPFFIGLSNCIFHVRIFAKWQGVNSWQLLDTFTTPSVNCP